MRSIRRQFFIRVVLPTILFGVVFLTVQAASIVLAARDAIERQTIVAESMAHRIDGHLTHLRHIIESAASALVAVGEPTFAPLLFQELVRDLGEIDALALIGPDGRVVHANDASVIGFDYSGLPHVRDARATATTTWGNPWVPIDGGRVVVSFAVPLARGFIVAADIVLGDEEHDSVDHAMFTADNSFVLTDRFGTLIYHPDRRVVEERQNIATIPPIADAEARSGVYRDPFSDLRVFGVARQTSQGWFVVSSTPVARALRPVAATTVLLIAIAAVGGTVLVILLRLALGSMVDPIVALTAFADAIARGDFETELSKALVADSREIASLAESMRGMRRAITARNRALEEGTSALERELSERKRVTEALRASVHEKEILIREVHHRVKNNLQVIASLLELQSDRFSNDEDRVLLITSQQRIQSIALVHEMLYQTPGVAMVDVATYAETLMGTLAHFFPRRAASVVTEISGDHLMLSIETAVPVGMMLNEMATNSYKYAFADRSGGAIAIVVSAGDGRASITYRDDGSGPDFDPLAGRSDTLGTLLLAQLADQIGGTITTRRDGGFGYDIEFPVSPPPGAVPDGR